MSVLACGTRLESEQRERDLSKLSLRHKHTISVHRVRGLCTDPLHVCVSAPDPEPVTREPCRRAVGSSLTYTTFVFSVCSDVHGRHGVGRAHVPRGVGAIKIQAFAFTIQ